MISRCLFLFAWAIVLSGCATGQPRPTGQLQPFTDARPFAEYVRKAALWDEIAYPPHSLLHSWARPSTCPDEDDDCEELGQVYVTAMRLTAADSITNNQESGADEGDIIKRVGDFLVLLRRGRLFTFSVPSASSLLEAIDYIDIAPADESLDAWYDEILTLNNTVILLGYSYEIEASLVRLFTIDDSGQIKADQSFFLKSSDYYDGSNYATRLIGDSLIFYFPRDVFAGDVQVVSGQIIDGKPVGASGALSSEQIYQPIQQGEYPVLHTIARCPLDSDRFECEATSFVGPEARLFYISRDAVYLWLNSFDWAYDFFVLDGKQIEKYARNWNRENQVASTAVVYRIPVEGGRPSAVETKGWPMNQFSFRQTDESLQVLARESHWSEPAKPFLIDIPLTQFSEELQRVPADRYQYLPELSGELLVNRFVGESLIYDDVEWSERNESEYEVAVVIKDLATTTLPIRLPIEHLVERVEILGDVALAIGTDYKSRLGFTAIRLGNQPVLGSTFWLDRAHQADERSHSFNTKVFDSLNVFGLPVYYVPDTERYDHFWLDENAAVEVHMKFLGMSPDLSIQSLGSMVSTIAQPDNCLVSCEDWYGGARPFFIDDNLFSLIEYDLIAGFLSGAEVFESSRVSGLSLLSVSD